jgi:hypothetical protein
MELEQSALFCYLSATNIHKIYRADFLNIFAFYHVKFQSNIRYSYSGKNVAKTGHFSPTPCIQLR